MIRTIVVDDEIWVCQLIKSLIDWQELGFELVGDADDGQRALEMILEKKPDLVITDIRMPGFTGLSLTERLRSSLPDTICVVISGYSDFDYARQALENGVFAYLLKPIDKTELTNVLLRVRKSIMQRHEEESENNRVKDKLIQSISHLKEDYFRKLMFGEIKEPKTMEEICEEYGVRFKPGKYRAVLYEITGAGAKSDSDEMLRQNITDNIYDLLPGRFGPNCCDTVKFTLPGRVALLLNYGEDKQTEVLENIYDSYEKVMEKVHMHRDYGLVIGIGEEASDLEGLRDSFLNAEVAARARIYYKDKNVISISGEEYAKRSLEDVLSFEKESRLIRQMDVLDTQSLEKTIREIMQQPLKLHPALVFELAEKIADILFNVIRRRKDPVEFEEITQEKLVRDIRESYSIEEMIMHITGMIRAAKDFYSLNQKDQQKRTVEQIKRFIHDHYMENIGLEDISGTVFLSSKYASLLFKQEMNTTIMEYLTDYRMDIAKELLLKKKYRTAEIMKMVGYNDARYFSKVFKKRVGINPTEYRKLFT